jgi:hypothetical protein
MASKKRYLTATMPDSHVKTIGPTSFPVHILLADHGLLGRRANRSLLGTCKVFEGGKEQENRNGSRGPAARLGMIRLRGSRAGRIVRYIGLKQKNLRGFPIWSFPYLGMPHQTSVEVEAVGSHLSNRSYSLFVWEIADGQRSSNACNT